MTALTPPTTSPRVSIAIACVNGLPYIDECLASFERQTGGIDYEVIVADRCNGACRAAVRKYPNARLIEVDRPEATIPQLRALAIREARGELVGITEDHCVAPAKWLSSMVEAHERGHRIVGGPIENAETRRLVDWAVFFCEYSAFEPPVNSGFGSVPGNNTTYDRELLTLIDDLLDQGVWEDEFNARLASHGHGTFVEPSAVMLHKKSFGLLEFVSQRYHYARSYAGMRVREAPFWRKLAYGALAVTALPLILLLRIVTNVWAKRRHQGKLLAALPLLGLFVAAWGFGEMVGYWAGPGDSLSRVE